MLIIIVLFDILIYLQISHHGCYLRTNITYESCLPMVHNTDVWLKDMTVS